MALRGNFQHGDVPSAAIPVHGELPVALPGYRYVVNVTQKESLVHASKGNFPASRGIGVAEKRENTNEYDIPCCHSKVPIRLDPTPQPSLWKYVACRPPVKWDLTHGIPVQWNLHLQPSLQDHHLLKLPHFSGMKQDSHRINVFLNASRQPSLIFTGSFCNKNAAKPLKTTTIHCSGTWSHMK